MLPEFTPVHVFESKDAVAGTATETMTRRGRRECFREFSKNGGRFLSLTRQIDPLTRNNSFFYPREWIWYEDLHG